MISVAQDEQLYDTVMCSMRLSFVVVNEPALGGPTAKVLSSHPGHANSNLGQVVYTHCLPSLLSSKKLG